MDPVSMLQALFSGGATTATPAPLPGNPADAAGAGGGAQPGSLAGAGLTSGGPLGNVLAQLSTKPRYQNRTPAMLGNRGNIAPAPSKGGAVAQGFMQAMDAASAAQTTEAAQQAAIAKQKADDAKAAFEQMFRKSQLSEQIRHNKASEADSAERTRKGIGGPKSKEDKEETINDILDRGNKSVIAARKAAGIPNSTPEDEAVAASPAVAAAVEARDAAVNSNRKASELDPESTDPNVVGGDMPAEATVPPDSGAAPMPPARPDGIGVPVPPPAKPGVMKQILDAITPSGGAAPPISAPPVVAPAGSPPPAPPAAPAPPVASSGPAAGAAPAPKVYPAPTPAAVQFLLAHPDTVGHFETTFGPGSAAALLQQGQPPAASGGVGYNYGD